MGEDKVRKKSLLTVAMTDKFREIVRALRDHLGFSNDSELVRFAILHLLLSINCPPQGILQATPSKRDTRVLITLSDEDLISAVERLFRREELGGEAVHPKDLPE